MLDHAKLDEALRRADAMSRRDAEFEESEHPRDELGRFARSASERAHAATETAARESTPENHASASEAHRAAREAHEKARDAYRGYDESVEYEHGMAAKRHGNVAERHQDKRFTPKKLGELQGESKWALQSSKNSGGYAQPAALAVEQKQHVGEAENKGAAKPKKTPPPKRSLLPGNEASFKTGDEKLDVKPGTVMYHTTDAKFSQFAGRPTWFTPFKSEAQGYQKKFEQDARQSPRTMKVTWRGGKIASMDDVRHAVDKVWGPEEDILYSMFDERVGEFEPKKVRQFISALKADGFAGAIVQDYSSRDLNKDADTLAVFDPRESIDIDDYDEDVKR